MFNQRCYRSAQDQVGKHTCESINSTMFQAQVIVGLSLTCTF